jgi:hypothetical protein
LFTLAHFEIDSHSRTSTGTAIDCGRGIANGRLTSAPAQTVETASVCLLFVFDGITSSFGTHIQSFSLPDAASIDSQQIQTWPQTQSK